jgi:hypothetical protein
MVMDKAFIDQTLENWTSRLTDLEKEIQFEQVVESGRTTNDPHEILNFVNLIRHNQNRLERAAMDFAIANDWTYDQIYQVLKR